MEELIRITWLNDFLFCPASIYFHNLVENADRMELQSEYQINGTNAHRSIEEGGYSSSSNILLGQDVYSEKYGITGKIDIFDIDKGLLTERKKHQSVIYPGLVLQLYAQCFGLRESGYEVRKMRIHSLDNNKSFDIELPEDNEEFMRLFTDTIERMKQFDIRAFIQEDVAKCRNCIYRPICSCTDYDDEC